MRRKASLVGLAILCLIPSPLFPSLSNAQTGNERSFSQSKPEVEKVLKELQPYISGKLPTLDGFAVPGERSLDHFQRGFYQCTVQVASRPSGGSLVRVNAKITAWYAAPTPATQSGYQVLSSNGRLESDLLDRLEEALGREAAPAPSARAPANEQPKRKVATSSATKTEPMSTIAVPDAPSTSASSQVFRKMGTPADNEAPSVATKRAVADRHLDQLRTDAKNLEEILRNQSHPTNLVAVKDPNTPILATPNEGGKVLFLAAAEDEFEMLDLNASWVHVRISGLSRGWIQRAHLDLSDDAASNTAQAAVPAPMPAVPPATTAKTSRYQVEHEEMASFPGDWAGLRGKTVKIITAQQTMPTGGDSQAKLDFARSLFQKAYTELSQEQTTAAGVVVVFDSVDGGMLAATLPVLKQWKEGTLSDEAMWRRCYVDPPEMLSGLTAQ